MDSKAFVTVRDFAVASQTTASAIRKLCREGLLPAQKTPGGGRWRIPSSELQKWLDGFLPAKEVRRG